MSTFCNNFYQHKSIIDISLSLDTGRGGGHAVKSPLGPMHFDAPHVTKDSQDHITWPL